MRPLVTIITPSLNQGRFIEAAIRSVLDQGYEPLEYLVYDGGSSDETPSILRSYGDRLCAVVGRDAGQAAAVRSAMRAARGDIVGWLNSDDTYTPGAIATAVRALVEHPECSAVFGEGQYIDELGNVLAAYPTAPATPLRYGCFICQPSVFMRRSALEAVDFVDPGLEFCMDYDLWLRLERHAPLHYIPVLLSCYRLHAESKSVARQLDSRREVVRMTRRRLGATPLTSLYSFADLAVRHRLRRSLDEREAAGPLATALAAAYTALLALRYHPLPTAEDLRLLSARLRAGQALTPHTLPGRAAGDRR
jgi:glycosyltransferase involved in cell wall biosynthesis